MLFFSLIAECSSSQIHVVPPTTITTTAAKTKDNNKRNDNNNNSVNKIMAHRSKDFAEVVLSIGPRFRFVCFSNNLFIHGGPPHHPQVHVFRGVEVSFLGSFTASLLRHTLDIPTSTHFLYLIRPTINLQR